MDQYANLIAIGKPDFIEVKGVTFAGGGKKNQLSMANVPWHTEVIRFCEMLSASLKQHPDRDSLPTYEIASEHEHSCCILLANVQKFKPNNVWHTWIDFDKFLELQAKGDSFTSDQYMWPTPDWAVFGHEQRGFDPEEIRFKKVRNHIKKDISEPEDTYVGGGC
jgi:tRNA wybutosine-synthesizing protein 1